MKKLVGTIAIAICCAVAEPQIVKAADAPAPVIVDNSGKFYVDGQYLYVSAGAVIMKRSRPGGGAIIAGNPSGVPFYSGGDFSFGWETGFDGTIGWRFWDKESIEARFFHFDTKTSTNFVSPGNFIGVGFTGPGGTRFQNNYQTNLESWEVNWRHQLFDHISVLAGVRDIGLTDSLTSVLNTTVATGSYNYRNRLFGAQIGADWAVLASSNPFQINVFGKTGWYSQKSQGGISEFQGPNFIGGFFSPEVKSQSYVSEVGASVGYHVTKNVLIRAGYQAMWISNLGLASNNASASLLNPSLLRNTVYRDNLFLQGANFGANITW